MSASRKSRARAAQQAATITERALLERCGLVDAAGQVVGAEGLHPDARLLELVAEYTTLMETVRALYRRLHCYKEGGRAYKRLWREMLSTRDQEEVLEREIVATKAHTPILTVSCYYFGAVSEPASSTGIVAACWREQP